MISVTRDADWGGMLLVEAVCTLAVLALGECRVSMLVCVDAMRGYDVTLCYVPECCVWSLEECGNSVEECWLGSLNIKKHEKSEEDSPFILEGLRLPGF